MALCLAYKVLTFSSIVCVVLYDFCAFFHHHVNCLKNFAHTNAILIINERT